jgi:hypothetical protein
MSNYEKLLCGSRTMEDAQKKKKKKKKPLRCPSGHPIKLERYKED